jgi:hypothetical protein
MRAMTGRPIVLECNVVATYAGLDNILATATFVAEADGSLTVEIQQSIDDEGPCDINFALNPEQAAALRAVLGAST